MTLALKYDVASWRAQYLLTLVPVTESVVVLWVDGREVSRLDVSKLAPSSESLQSIEKNSDRNCQVINI